MQARASSSETTAYDPPGGAGRWLVVCAQVCVIPDTAEFRTFHSPPKEIPWPFAIAPRAPCPSPPALGNPSPTSFRGRLLGPQRCPRIPVSDAQGEAGNVRAGSRKPRRGGARPRRPLAALCGRRACSPHHRCPPLCGLAPPSPPFSGHLSWSPAQGAPGPGRRRRQQQGRAGGEGGSPQWAVLPGLAVPCCRCSNH